MPRKSFGTARDEASPAALAVARALHTFPMGSTPDDLALVTRLAPATVLQALQGLKQRGRAVLRPMWPTDLWFSKHHAPTTSEAAE